ncbi:acyltransferase [Clostridium perfringens]|uniref:acyltransferase n=1 Tax=Clostridium perfringens TaxID=1502 RepID=UPI002AC4E033|nr:acyltransferase [Clostridium perfringens]EJT6165230.1 acyltransferase [Clostridium perfringens]EJT6656696.1 acyltransferase [Clostridium perfringens]EJT6657979.1 acyltransferase [Clostridium perfringens]MDZ4970317.1 acyltransferase [Clostridium perfringens]MDZ5023245.1 acyltransferase [Clostridium perfringens]
MVIKRIFNSIKYRIVNRINPKTQLDMLKERGLKVGKNFNMFNSVIDEGHCWLVEIGDDVTITNSTILAHDASMKRFINKSKIGKVKIGDRVFIGYGSILLPNISIGSDVIIGAGTVVNRDIPDDSIVVGNPARIIGKVSEFEERHKRLLNEKKVYETYWPYKTQEDIKKIQDELNDDFGYDP